MVIGRSTEATRRAERVGEAVERAVAATRRRQSVDRVLLSPAINANGPATKMPPSRRTTTKTLDVGRLNRLIKTIDSTWTPPRRTTKKEPIGSNFQFKKTCASIYKARENACQQLGFAVMCFNFCYEQGEKLTLKCENLSDAYFCASNANFGDLLLKYRKDAYRAKSYIHQMMSRCYATAFCDGDALLNATRVLAAADSSVASPSDESDKSAAAGILETPPRTTIMPDRWRSVRTSLEERAKEIEALRKDLLKVEKERNTLESQRRTFDSHQPPDVQALLAQKKELNAQLKREESEKHELFSQINKLIGEIADLRATPSVVADASADALAALSAEHDELKRDFGRKEAAFQTIKDELAAVRVDAERRERTLQLEKSRLAAEVQDAQRELEFKSAALRSLRLATQDTGSASEDLSYLREELGELRAEVAEKEDLLKELTESNDELGRALSTAGADMDTLRAKFMTLHDDLRAATEEKAKLNAELNSLKAETTRVDAEALERAKTELREKESTVVDALAGELKAARNELMALQQYVGELEAALVAQPAAQESYSDTLASLTAERDRLRSELAAAGARLARVNERVHELEESLELAERRADEFDVLGAELRAEKLVAEANLAKLRAAENSAQLADAKAAELVLEFAKALELPCAAKFSRDKIAADYDKIAAAARDELQALRTAARCANDTDGATTAELAKLRCELDASHAEVFDVWRELAQDGDEKNILIKKLLTNKNNLRVRLAAQTDETAARTTEYERLHAEHTDAKKELRALRNKVSALDELTAERATLEARVQQLNADVAAKDKEIERLRTSTSNSGDEKVQELIDENARLAGDLLKHENEARREYRAELTRERDAWLAERGRLEAEMERLRANAAEASAPKPRKSAASTAEPAPTGDAEDNAVEIQRLRANLEKQKRLVTVLRKKLQPELLANGMKTLPRRLQ